MNTQVITVRNEQVAVQWLSGVIRKVKRHSGQIDIVLLNDATRALYTVSFWSDAQKEVLRGLNLSEGNRVAFALNQIDIPVAGKQL